MRVYIGLGIFALGVFYTIGIDVYYLVAHDNLTQMQLLKKTWYLYLLGLFIMSLGLYITTKNKNYWYENKQRN